MLKRYDIQEDKESIRVINNFFSDNSEVKKYIFGTNIDSGLKELSDIVEIDAFIDDFSIETYFLNKPIVKTDNIDKNSLVVVCSTVRTVQVLELLRNKGFINVVDYITLFKYSKKVGLKLRYIENFDIEFYNNQEKFNKVCLQFKDSLSQNIFEKLVNYKLTGNINLMQDFRCNLVGQYFEDFLDLQEDEVFVDAGGFDGQTSIEFIKHCPKYKSIYIFEPSEENLELAKENLKEFHNVNFISKGLSNKKETLKFDINGASGTISETGTVTIEVDTLDNLVNEKVTFIKMDIEGAEGLAIEGMKGHILKDHPKMAISVYHKVDDFWKIPEQIFAIRDDYDIYMRHYTEGTDETVMFFMPKNTQ